MFVHCRLEFADCVIVKVIGTSLHNLEQLYLNDLKNDNSGSCTIKGLVTGCPKLKILHLGSFAALVSVEYLLLGLPNLIEFRHPLVIFALEKIIRDGRADRVSSLRTLHIGDRDRRKFGVRDVYESGQMVINHLINVTKLHITVVFEPCKELLHNLSESVFTMSHLTELTWREISCTDIIVPIMEVVGHQLRSLDLFCENYMYSCIDVIDQCRELRVLSIEFTTLIQYNFDPNYGSDLHEQFTPFQHLQKLHLNGLNHSHLKPALFKSLIASPVLQDLKLQRLPNFTDHIMKAVFCHINEEGEQLAFTSLRKLELRYCDCITNYLKNVVTHERVPLEMLTIC